MGTRRPGILTALALALGAVVAPGGPVAAAPGPADEIGVTDLPVGLTIQAFNDRAQVVGQLAGELVLVEGGEVTATLPRFERHPHPGCPVWCFFPVPRSPSLNDRGVVGTDIGGHASLWDDGRVTDLNGDASFSWLLDVDDRGDALVLRFTDDGRQVLGHWRRGDFTEIRSWSATEAFVGARLEDTGQVIVSAMVARPQPPPAPPLLGFDALLWDRGVTTDLTAFAPSGVNERGQVAGVVWDPSSPLHTQPAAWDGGEVTVLPTLGGHQHGTAGIDRRGRIVGYSTIPEVRGLVTVLWDDGELVDIGSAVEGSDQPAGLTDSGQVLVRADRAGAVWEDGDLRLLPGGGVEPFAINERDQVVGYRDGPDPFGLNIPTLWEL